jgi:hypothetical protein
MNLFWFTGEHDPQLLGLYDFKSATWGDGIILPLLAYFLVRLGSWHKPLERRRERLAVGVVAALCGLGGALTQIEWLRDPQTVLNWTIPAPGQFNAAGWYHAAFLCGASALFGALFAQAFMRLWKVRASGVGLSRTSEAAWALMLLPFFPVLLAIDFVTAGTDPVDFFRSTAWLCLVGPAALALLAPLLWRRGLLPALLGSASALTLGALIVFAPAQEPSTWALWLAPALFSANFALPLWRGTKVRQVAMTAILLLTLSILAGVLLYRTRISPEVSLWIHAVVIIVLAALVLAVSRVALAPFEVPTRPFVIETLVNVGVLLTVVTFGGWVALRADHPAADGLFVLWSISIVSAIAFEKYLFNRLVAAEANGARLGAHRMRAYSWGLITLVTVGMNITLGEVVIADGATPALGGQPFQHSTRAAMVYLGFSGVTLLVALARPALTILLRRALCAAGAVGVTLLGLAALGEILGAARQHDRAAWLLATLVIPTLGIMAFAVLSVLGNIYLLRGKQLSRLAWFYAMGLGIFMGVGPALGLSLLVLGPTVWDRMIGIAVMVSVTTVPVLCSMSCYRDDLKHYLATTEPRWGLVQDAILSVLLYATVVGYPIYNLLVQDALETVVVRSVSVLGVIACLYGWILSNNVEHARKYGSYDDSTRFDIVGGVHFPVTREELHRRIRFHIRAQNVISAIMILPVVPYLITSLDVEEVGMALLGDADQETPLGT